MTIKLADYLFTRLRQLGVHSVFGVPGDYNLRLLDFVQPSGLDWIGNCNELNAAYAADGYARIKDVSALITTFGVGELSAINGIAGAYTERAAVIHIVGTPSRALQSSRSWVHHTLADGDYRRFGAMASHVTVAQVDLKDSRRVPGQIDWVLGQSLLRSRPVYLQVPEDMADVDIDASNLKSSISVPSAPVASLGLIVMERILELIYTARHPLILVDGESRSMGILDEIEELVRMTGWPTWTTIFGKSLINEQLPNVYGIYSGRLGRLPYKDYFDSADLILKLGPHYSDTNSQNFTTILSQAASITFSHNSIQFGSEVYTDISSDFISQLLRSIDETGIPRVTGPPKPTIRPDLLSPSHDIMQKHFYRIVNSLFRDGDLIFTETGTAAHGGRNFILPPNTRLFGPVTWLSIGYMLPATLGAVLAQRERNNGRNTRGILFIGDGSLQMSVQEISTIIREKLNVVIFVINNGGYTIERAIHGRKQAYNDIASWRHALAMSFFGANGSHAIINTFAARTWEQLDLVLKDQRVQQGEGVRMVEVFMDREDVDGALLRLMERQIQME